MNLKGGGGVPASVEHLIAKLTGACLEQGWGSHACRDGKLSSKEDKSAAGRNRIKRPCGLSTAGSYLDS